jgi:hypothetical protein
MEPRLQHALAQDYPRGGKVSKTQTGTAEKEKPLEDFIPLGRTFLSLL